MQNKGQSVLLRYAIWAHIVAGFGAAVFVLTHFSLPSDPNRLWFVVPALALIAEFLPVQLTQRGLRITFTLPFVAGVATAMGPSAALLTDVSVTLLAAVVLGWSERRNRSSLWIAVNVAVAALSTFFAGAVFVIVQGALGSGQGEMALGALAFTAAYALTNFVLVTMLDVIASGGHFRDNVWSSLKLGGQGLALYCLVSISVSVLLHAGLESYVPLTMLPVLALRTALVMKARMVEHYYETITALTLMLQRAHPYTHGHLERAAKAAEAVALRLGLSPARARLVREAAVLHDIGKIAIDERILDKPGRLNEEEMDHVRCHSEFGAQILSPVPAFAPMVDWVRYHHERPDGKGYPARLSDIEIPLESKIIAVTDAFDAMVGGDAPSDRRSYRTAMTHAEALVELERCSGSQFDPKVVRAFREVLFGRTS